MTRVYPSLASTHYSTKQALTAVSHMCIFGSCFLCAQTSIYIQILPNTCKYKIILSSTTASSAATALISAILLDRRREEFYIRTYSSTIACRGYHANRVRESYIMSSSVRGRCLHSLDVQWSIRAVSVRLISRVFPDLKDVFYRIVLLKWTPKTKCNGKVLM